MFSKKSSTDMVKLYRTTRYERRDTDATIFKFFQSLDSPRSLTCWLLYSNGEHDQLVDLAVNPEHYNDALRFRDSYVATQFLAKADFLSLSVDKKSAALTKFREYEELCGRTNERFKDLSLDPSYRGSNVSLLSATIRKIDSILTSFTADEFVNSAGWGPGVSTLLKGKEVSAYNKFHAERGITRDLYRLVKPWFTRAYPTWHNASTDMGPYPDLDGHFDMQAGNEVITVSKNSKTDRVIAVEPGMNTWFQKAIGKMLRERLLKQGIDLDSQERNQQLSEVASLDDTLCTVDFSSASDSVSKSVVRTLVRDQRWLSLMEACRSKYGTLDSKTFKWNKFSAMGNGFTFELESLIFFATAFAVCEELGLSTEDISVFGDDVIIPKDAFHLYSSFTEFLGFRVNMKKSFSTSYFRESCGAHYFDGLDCKPTYLKKRISNVEAVFKLANSVRLLAHRYRNNNGCDRRFRTCWTDLLRRVPKSIRLGIPLGFGDGGIMMNLDEATPSVSSSVPQYYFPRPAKHGFEGFRFSLFSALGVTRESEKPAMLITRLWSQSAEQYNNTYTLRGTVRISLLRNVLAYQWYNLGPWC